MSKRLNFFAFVIISAAILMAAADVDIPNEVASQSFLNQTANISTTTLFTPTADGVFRISEYVTMNPNTTGSVGTVFSWTDDFQAQSTDTGRGNPSVFSNPNVIGGSYAFNTLVIKAKANTAISMSTSGNVNGYDVFVTVEKL